MPTFRDKQYATVTYQKVEAYTNDATPFPILFIPLAAGEKGTAKIDIVCSDDTQDQVNSYFGTLKFKRTKAGVITSGAIKFLDADEDTGFTGCNVTATVVMGGVGIDGENLNGININVVGIAARNINWSCIPDVNTTLYVQ